MTLVLDGRTIGRLTARKAHRGKLSARIAAARLGVGAHKLVAMITMDSTGSSPQPVVARTLTLVRCGPSGLQPSFAG